MNDEIIQKLVREATALCLTKKKYKGVAILDAKGDIIKNFYEIAHPHLSSLKQKQITKIMSKVTKLADTYALVLVSGAVS